MMYIPTFMPTQAVLISAALAQATSPAPGTAPATETGFNPLWLLIIVALIAAAAWYFMRRRSNASTTTSTGTATKTGVYDRKP